MKYLDLRKKITHNLFTFLDVVKLFPSEDPQLIKTQLSRFSQKKLITKIKRELYCFDPALIDEFVLANKLYQPSYISLETALNGYGIIPDIPQSFTSVTTTTTKKINNQFGSFRYIKIKQSLFFGFSSVQSSRAPIYYNLALKEKALLDYLYVRKLQNITDLRLNLSEINYTIYHKFARTFPPWVQKIITSKI
ncbi:MAG TPA: hypothetical protein VJB63_03705 [Patescibacteria group bacterium]|nr:hypothetical protein [Patescibacteria group bacterium]